MSKASVLSRPALVFSSPVKSSAKIKSLKPVSPVRVWFAYGLVAANVLLLAAYLFGVNSFTTQGYEIKKLQTKVANLTQDNKDLMVQTAEKNSMSNIQDESLKENFVPVAQVKYLQIDHLTYSK